MPVQRQLHFLLLATGKQDAHVWAAKHLHGAAVYTLLAKQ